MASYNKGEPIRPSPNGLGYYTEDGRAIWYGCIRHRGECKGQSDVPGCQQGYLELAEHDRVDPTPEYLREQRRNAEQRPTGTVSRDDEEEPSPF